MAEVNLTGGGEQFLLLQATSPDTHILWIVGMMLLHFVFSIFSFSSGLPGGSFIPIGNRRIAGTNRSLDNGPAGSDCL